MRQGGTDVSLSAVACCSCVWVLCLLCCQKSCLPTAEAEAEAEASHCSLLHSVLDGPASFPLWRLAWTYLHTSGGFGTAALFPSHEDGSSLNANATSSPAGNAQGQAHSKTLNLVTSTVRGKRRLESGSFQNIPLSEAQPQACCPRSPSDFLSHSRKTNMDPVSWGTLLWGIHSTLPLLQGQLGFQEVYLLGRP